MFRLLRVILALPFLTAGLILGAVGVYGLWEGHTPYVPAYLVLAFLSLALAGGILPKKGRYPRYRKGGTSSSRTWRHGTATEKQKSFARELGIKFPANISKGDLSNLITKKTGKF